MKKSRILLIGILSLILLFAFAAFAGAETLALGDVDGDGSVTPSDARFALRAAVGLNDRLREIQMAVANVDGEGGITPADARLILRTAVGLDSLSGSVHAHDPGAPVHEKEVIATCTKAGSYEEIISCAECGEELSRKAVNVPKTAHTPGAAKRENEVAATCTKDGSYNETVRCTKCNTIISTKKKTTTAPGHIKTLLPEESVFSLTGDNTLVYACSRCGKNGVDPTDKKTYDATLRSVAKLGNNSTRENVDIVNHFLNDVKKNNKQFHALSLNSTSFSINEKGTDYNPDFLMKGFLIGFNLGVPKDERVPVNKSDFIAFLKEMLSDAAGDYNTATQFPCKLYNYNYPLYCQSVVSNLVPSDLQSVKVEKVKNYDFTASMPKTVPNTHTIAVTSNGYEYEMNSLYPGLYPDFNYETDGFIALLPKSNDIIKVTLTLKDETYNDLNTFVKSTNHSHIFKLNPQDFSIGNLESELGFGNLGDGFSGTASSSNTVKSKGTVTYYFDGSGKALSAVYDATYTVQNIMKMDFSVVNGLSLLSLNLKVDITSTNTAKSYYILDPGADYASDPT